MWCTLMCCILETWQKKMDFVGRFTINPHETKLVLLGLPRGLNGLLHMLNAIVSSTKVVLGFSFFYSVYLPEDVQMVSVGMFDKVYFYIYFR